MVIKMKKFFLFLFSAFFLFGCTYHNVLGTYSYENADKYVKYEEPLGIDIFDGKTFNSLVINWIAGEVEIKDGETFSIKEEQIKGDYHPLFWSDYSQDFIIQYVENNTPNADINNHSKKLIITTPKELFKNLKLDFVSAKFTVEKEHVDLLDIDTVSGDGNVTLQTAQNIKIDSVSSNIDLTIKSSLDLASIEIDQVSGDSTLNLDDSRGYNLDFDTVSGNVKQEFYKGSNESLTNFDIEVDTVSGNLNIKKI